MFSKILKFEVFNGTKYQLLNYIKGFEKVNIVSGNPEVLYNGLKDKDMFQSFTSKNSVIIPDGVGTLIASRIVKNPVNEKIAGIDVMEEIINICKNNNYGIYLIGAKEDVLRSCIYNLKLKYPGINISGSHNGYFDLNNCEKILEDIKKVKPYALFIAMGSPRQDRFIIKNMEELPCKVFMGVGGSFDVFSGKLKRAPKWMINFGLEWLYRVIKEPWRIKRLIVIPRFLIKVAVDYKSRISSF
ncbi:glycosyltransferase [Clostridium fermenticellae]|uniref:N-acetylglucosaminyldiphosphoundecaprenol N-acetyl-beta-D-mannosaminyltransferase n=1 Tax=Clostridium fermenticellae TaxID=2068654 RepID=A0A386H287_9CLOT|nr:WecB/TagA/CpsF family glycosyltransferase [Clostridium fermenticellae]AYD39809.1 glycosyltransferase [Clostridium fermenticellae]